MLRDAPFVRKPAARQRRPTVVRVRPLSAPLRGAGYRRRAPSRERPNCLDPHDAPGEVLITGRRNHLPITGEVRDLLTQPRQRQVLAYGWPLVVVLDRTSRARVGALFIAEIEVAEAHSRLLPSSDQPSLNPSLFGMDYFDAPAVDAAREVAAALVFTSAETVTTGVRQVLTELQLDCDTLDPDALGRDSPLRPGVHNRAGVFLSEGSLMTRSLLDELEALERRSDWSQHSSDDMTVAICGQLGLLGRTTRPQQGNGVGGRGSGG